MLSQTLKNTVARSSKTFKLLSHRYITAVSIGSFAEVEFAIRRIDLFNSPKYDAPSEILGERKREYRHSREIIIITLGRGVGVTLEIRRVIPYRAAASGKQCAEILLSPEAFPTFVRQFYTVAFSVPCEKNYFAVTDKLTRTRVDSTKKSSFSLLFVGFIFHVCTK